MLRWLLPVLVLIAATAAWAQGKPGMVNVRDFGAKGDGVTNDAAAIQRAIDALGAEGGAVYVPRGAYFIGMLGEHPVQGPPPQNFVGYGVQLRSNVTLTGDGPGATIFHARHRKTEAEQYSVLVVKDVANVIIEKVGIRFDPLPIDPQQQRFTNEYAVEEGYTGQRLQCGVDIRYSQKVTIRDIAVQHAGQGISCFFGNGDILIDSVRMHNCYGCGIGIYAGASRTVVSNSLITDCSDGMLSSYANAGEVEFLNNRVACTPDNQRGDSQTQLITVEASRFVKVIGNHCEGGTPAIDLKRTRDTIVMGNTVCKGSWGICVRPGDHPAAAGYSWRSIIANNHIDDLTSPSGAIGIQVTAGAFAVIEGNMLNRVDGDAICVDLRTHFRQAVDGHHSIWPLSGRGVSIANNVIVRRSEEFSNDAVKNSVVMDPTPTPAEKWDPFDATQPPVDGLFHDAHRAIIVANAPGIAITGNMVRGGRAADWPHAGGIVISECDGFTFTGNSLGDGNQGRGLLVQRSSGVISGNALEGATEYALRLDNCSATTVTGNRINFRAQHGAAIDVVGATRGCVVSANTVFSDGLLVTQSPESAGEGVNTFTANMGRLRPAGGSAGVAGSVRGR
jgi:hypothetical protein